MPDPGLQAESLPATVRALNSAVNEVGILVGRLKRNVVTEVPEFVLQQWQGRMATQANTIRVLQERVEKSDSLLESRDQRIKELERAIHSHGCLIAESKDGLVLVETLEHG